MAAAVEPRSGFEGTLNELQSAALNELKTRLETSAFAEDLKAHPDGDRWILRFLRATMKDKHGERIFLVDQAEARLLKTMEWRRKYGVEDMLKSIEAEDVVTNRPAGYDLYDKKLPSHMVINKTNGEMVLYNRVAAAASHIDESVQSSDEWAKAIAYGMERIMHMMRVESKVQGREISSYKNVMDCAGLSLTGVIAKRKFLQFLSECGADNYPECLGKTFLVNCPWYFGKIWDLMKPFIDKDTLAKLAVYSGVPLEELLKHVPRELILKEFGGDNTVDILNRY